MAKCPFCFIKELDGESDRVAGLDICAECLITGPATYSLVHFRIRHSSRCDFRSERVGNRSVRSWHYTLRFELPEPPGVDLSCETEAFSHRLIKLFRGELQVGDPLFDDMIYVRTTTHDAAAELLASEGLQSAIMGVVGSGTFRLEGDVLTAYAVSYHEPWAPDPKARFSLEAAAAAIHVCRWMEAR